jgi:hypothetical protein
MNDLPRLAEGTTAEGFAGVQKLLNVRIENGWVHATLPNVGDGKCWWSPWEEYLRDSSEPPFLRLLQCGSSERDVASFLQSYGAIVEGRRGEKGHIAFPLAQFHFEKWQFSFVTGLLREYSRPEDLGGVFIEKLSDAGAALRKSEGLQKSKGPMERGPWGQAVLQVWYTFNRQDPPLAPPGGREWWAPVLDALKSNLTKMKPPDIQKAAGLYIANRVTEKIKKLRLAFNIGVNGPRSYAYSDDLLESFYWMLAEYFAGRKHLSRCAFCETIFVGSGKYCPKVRCKELGRRRLDWKRNKAKYNRNRQMKRREKGK